MTQSVWLKHPGLSAGVEEMVVWLAGRSYGGGDGGGSMGVEGRDRGRLLPATPNVWGTHGAQLNICKTLILYIYVNIMQLEEVYKHKYLPINNQTIAIDDVRS